MTNDQTDNKLTMISQPIPLSHVQHAVFAVCLAF